VLLPTLLATGAALALAYRGLREDLGRALGVSARLTARSSGNFLLTHVSAVAVAASVAPGERERALAETRARFPAFRTLWATDAQGAVLQTAPAERRAGPGPLSVADRAHFREVKASGRTFVSPAFRGRGAAGEVMVAVSAPVVDASGATVGVVGGSLSKAAFAAQRAETLREQGYELLLLDAQGAVVYASEGLGLAALTPLGATAAWRERLSRPGVPFELDGAPGGPGRLLGVAATSDVGWTAVLLAPRAQLLAPLLREGALVGFATLSLLLGVLLSGVTIRRRLREAMARLEGRLEDFAFAEEPAPLRVEGMPEEFARLPESLDHMAGRLNRAFQEQRAALLEQLRLRESEERFRGVLESVRAMALTLDTRGRVTFVNEHALQLTGWAREQVVGEEWFGRFMPDGAGLAARFRQAMEDGQLVAHFEGEVLTREGGRRTVSWDNALLRDAQGRVTGSASLGQDVTEERRAQAALAEERRLAALLHRVALVANGADAVEPALAQALRTLCTHLGWEGGHALLREEGALVATGAWHAGGADAGGQAAGAPTPLAPLVAATAGLRFAAADGRLTGLAALAGLAGEVLLQGRALWVGGPGEVPGAGRAAAAREAGVCCGALVPVLVGAEVVAVLELYATRPQAQDARLLRALVDVGAMLGRVFERAEARARLEAHAEQVRALSMRDELTGLYNRRGFLAFAGQQLAVARRTGRTGALLFVDLDGLKRVNDGAGHAAGDRLLARAAEVLRATFRTTDVVARLGGDEFISYVGECTPEGLVRLRERLDEAVAASNAAQAPGAPALAMSVGVTWCTQAPGVPLEALVAEADAAMYAQKRLRRAGAP
jgi:diguanylate cyclase (GGDEF)-like protein/PAS domain S-box-containing protein